jgi:hypothetical protein
MIYLNPENASGLGEDTFWTWLNRELPNTAFGVPDRLEPGDVVLQYSTLGYAKHPDQTIALLWELYPEMKRALGSSEWDGIIGRIQDAALSSRRRTVASALMLPDYAHHGRVDVLPIGVDTDLFRPMDKAAMRRKYGFADDARVGFWSGTAHPMKGYDRLQAYGAANPDIQWITVWKHAPVPQSTLAELMNCADFLYCPGRLRPFFMVEWEAMACGLRVEIPDGMVKDFQPSDNPRADVFRLGWDRRSALKRWADYLCDD